MTRVVLYGMNPDLSNSFFHFFRFFSSFFCLRKNPTAAGNCIGCGKCERHCPQGIEIRKELENVKRDLEDRKFRLIRWVLKAFKIFG